MTASEKTASADEAHSNELAKAAAALEDAGNFSEALVKWRDAVSRDASPFALFRLGRVATRLGESDEAERSLLAAIKAAPTWGLAYVALGRVYRNAGNFQKARDLLRQGVQHGVREAWSLSLLGDALIRLGQSDEAEQVLSEALAIDPNYEEAYFLLAQAKADDPASRPEDVIALYRHAIDLDSDYSLAHRELGWALRRLDQFEMAEQHVRRATETDGTDALAFIYLGNILWRKGDLEGATGAFEKAIEVDPDDSTAYWCLADLRRAQGRSAEARHLLRESLALRLDSVPANLRLALLLRELGHHRKANRYLKRVLHLEPENAVARKLLAQASSD